jgi:hypothetical protein
MNTATKTRKNPEAKKAAAPTSSYLDQADVVLRKIGVLVMNQDVRQWVERQQEAGAEVSQLAELWAAPENAQLAAEAKDVARLVYVSEELERRVWQLTDKHTDLTKKIQADGPDKLVDLAADAAESLVETAAKLRTLRRFQEALEKRMATDEQPREIYESMSNHAYRELASKAAGLRGRSTSWQANESRNAELVALGDLASLFLDVARITEEPIPSRHGV